ncbi:MAG: hypothetical protein SFY81_06195 [Verrucomicrobiota bacterium]|nr:hypothetical protein [Verrucomicrobiota bacterium]
MERKVAIETIQQACKSIAVELMKIHPAVPALKQKGTEDALNETLLRMTEQLELIAKRMDQLEGKR